MIINMERHTNLKTSISTWKVNYNQIQDNQAYVQLENVVEKIVVLGSFQLGSFQLERQILSWKEPFEVGKLELKLEKMALVVKKMKLKTTA